MNEFKGVHRVADTRPRLFMTRRKPPNPPATPRDRASFDVAPAWHSEEKDAARRARASAELEAHSLRKPDKPG
ncbi:MAG TPA: hypothetical protein VF605_00470 [Allosphingosinicella sp.]